MLLLVGLGNPGPRYARNRHNVGFMAVDAIVRRHRFGPFRARFDGLAAEGEIGGEKVLALKPQTYMNDSGRAVAAAMRFYKLPPANVAVIHDELDLKPFKVKVKTGGGAAGHNGVRDIDAHIGPDFRRVRVGIGHPGVKELVMGHALSDFARAELPALEQTVEAIAEALALLVEGNDNGFMTRLDVLTKPPREEKEADKGKGKPPKAPSPSKNREKR
ncbi:MAG: aminoacyl-tRNA hydrolase [Rhodospirillales bacterium]